MVRQFFEKQLMTTRIVARRFKVRRFTATVVIACLLSQLQMQSANAQDSNAYIKLELDGTEIYAGDTVVLDIESSGLAEPLDLSLIEAQADILRQTKGSTIAIFGGKPVEIVLQRMDIVPKKSGVFVVGPLTQSGVTSNSVYLKVLDATRPEWVPEANDLQINTTLSSDTVAVNQEVFLTIELLHRYPISGESFTLPDLTGLPKRALVENRRTITGDNREWFRTAWEYLIFPDRSGPIQFDGVTWSGNTTKSRAEKSPFKRESEPLTLNVSPPAISDADWWLPANTLTLTEEWSKPPTELRAGDELNRTIRVNATSILAGQIPTPVILESRAMQQTLIKTHREETLTTDSILSKAEFTYRVKAQSPIPVFLDTIRIPWWSTRENSAKEAIIPARRINVGLPDRTDVLSQLALQETGVSRMKHWLQSADIFRMLMLLMGAISALYILFTLITALKSRQQHNKARKKYGKKLKALARAGDLKTLYQELHSTASKNHFSSPPVKLTQALEAKLFSISETPEPDSKGRSDIKNLLDELIKNSAPPRTPLEDNQATVQALAEL